MKNQEIVNILKKFQKIPKKGKIRQNYFIMFEKRMAYRTTKAENPKVTAKMVESVFHKINSKK